MDTITILWADDEINGLKPQIKFPKKRFQVITVSNGYDALEKSRKYWCYRHCAIR